MQQLQPDVPTTAEQRFYVLWQSFLGFNHHLRIISSPLRKKIKMKKYTTPKKKVSSLPSVPERVQSRLTVYCERCAPLNVCNELNFYIFWKIYYPIAVGKGFGGTGDPMHEGRGKVIEIIKTVYLFINTVQVARAFALLFRTLNRRKRRNLWWIFHQLNILRLLSSRSHLFLWVLAYDWRFSLIKVTNI